MAKDYDVLYIEDNKLKTVRFYEKEAASMFCKGHTNTTGKASVVFTINEMYGNALDEILDKDYE